MDGGAAVPWDVGLPVPGTAFNSAIVMVSAPEGRHVLAVSVEDQAGNSRVCAAWRWTYDPDPPHAWLLNTEDLPSATALSLTTFQVRRNRLDVAVWWALDGGA